MDLTSFFTLGRSSSIVSPFALGALTFGAGRWGIGEYGPHAILDAYGGHRSFVKTADVHGRWGSEAMLNRSGRGGRGGDQEDRCSVRGRRMGRTSITWRP